MKAYPDKSHGISKTSHGAFPDLRRAEPSIIQLSITLQIFRPIDLKAWYTSCPVDREMKPGWQIHRERSKTSKGASIVEL